MTTKLSRLSRAESLSGLRDLLGNVVGFVGFPVTDRDKLVSIWNERYPFDLVDAVRTLGIYKASITKYNGMMSDRVKWCTEIEGKLHFATVRVEDVGPFSPEKEAQGTIQYPLGIIDVLVQRGYFREVNVNVTENIAGSLKQKCYEFTQSDIANCFGDSLADEIILWMKQCAIMRQELILANVTLHDVFNMAITAGQLKRMVPDLLQYLPREQREAFENQKRASSMPFDWAPYPKKNIDVMLTQINKGHLLQGMRKPNKLEVTVEDIDKITWARSDVVWV